MTGIFLCIKITDCSVKKFGYNEHPLVTSSFFCIFDSYVYILNRV